LQGKFFTPVLAKLYYPSNDATFILIGSGEGYFFSDKMPNHWRSDFENGNSLSICSLPEKIFNIARKGTAAFA
jgi:hypothetical protein